MSARVKKNYPLLKWLSQAKPRVARSVIGSVDKEVLDSICEVCLNILKGNVPLSPDQKRRLCKHKQTLRRLACSSRGSEKVKRALVQKGGFLGALLHPLLSIGSLLLK